MRVTVTARHCSITPTLRERAKVVMARLDQLTPFGQEATVVFDADGERPTVEIRLRLSGGTVLVAESAAADHRTALDRAERKVRRQLERPMAKPSRRRGLPRKT